MPLNDRPLHICLISEEYPPDTGWGGIGTYTYNLARGLVQQGQRVQVVAGCLKSAATAEEEGVRVHRIGFAAPKQPVKRLIYRIFQVYTHRMPYLRRKLEFAHAAAGLIRRLHDADPLDLLETAEYDANGYFATRWGRIPAVVKIHTPLLVNYHLNRLPVTREVRWCDRLERRQTRRAACITTPSRAMKRLAEDWLQPRRDIRVLPNPIDTEEFSPAGPAVRDPGRYLFYTGRLERRKGVHILLEAFRRARHRIPEVKLVLAGHDTPTFQTDGRTVSFREYLTANDLLADIGDRVIFLGKVDRRELPAYYRGSVAGVFPSEEFENFPYTCLEAMACGRAVIVTDSGGMAEMVTDGVSGRCVPAGEAAPLAEALVDVAQRPDITERMGTAARGRILENYSMAAISRRTLDLYHEVCS
ncbi:MAG: glycosyltransferase family 4 protein [Acidobacteria bacterium]|nr:glycosyltransferase family 4 protein [Acidobacteriota bacterium]